MSLRLPIWTVYKKPRDYPGQWVAREWIIGPEGQPVQTENVIVADELATIRDRMAEMCLTYLPRDPSDDPAIFECWI